MPVTICAAVRRASRARRSASLVSSSSRSKSPPAENARPLPVMHRDPGVGVGVELREQPGQAEVQLVVGRVELLGPVEPDDPDRAVGLDLDHVGQVVRRSVMTSGRPRMRRGDEVPLDLRRAAHDALRPAVEVDLQPRVVARRRGRRRRSTSAAWPTACSTQVMSSLSIEPSGPWAMPSRRSESRRHTCRRSISASTIAQPRSRTCSGAVARRGRRAPAAASSLHRLACSGRRSRARPARARG